MLETIFRLTTAFIVYSILGALLERVAYGLGQVFDPKNAPIKAWNNPILTGFPIYGAGAVLILIAKSQIVDRYRLGLGSEFLLYSGILTLIELLTGYYIGAGKDSHLADGSVDAWDYSNNFLNFDGKIDAFHSLAYGVMGIVVARI